MLIDQKNMIIVAKHRSGTAHGRVMEAKELGMEEVPTIRIEHLSESEKRVYILADNNLQRKPIEIKRFWQ